MDFVLDALLQSLTDLISCDCARIWLLEGDTRLFVAREKVRRETSKKRPTYPLTLDAADIPFVQRILGISQALLFSDTKHEPDWQTFTGHTHLRSWLCVPLVASQHTLGLLSVGHNQPDSFTREDLRRAQLLAIPAAVAIQNSRLYECASIYGSELEKRIHDLHAAKKPWSNQKKAERFRRTSSRKSSVQVRSPSRSQPSLKDVSSMSIPLSRNAMVIPGRT
jgi:GAF domain-containing protein